LIGCVAWLSSSGSWSGIQVAQMLENIIRLIPQRRTALTNEIAPVMLLS
jgi:hypothetical protein